MEIRRADAAAPDYCFPNKLEDIAVLTRAGECLPERAKKELAYIDQIVWYIYNIVRILLLIANKEV